MSMQPESPRFLSVKQVAEYLSLHEKKVYALVGAGKIPGTKITGKWLFPKELVDKWMLESSHGGLLTDRLIVAGSDDALLHRMTLRLSDRLRARALIGFTPMVTRLGLEMLQGRRVDACCVHWGRIEESRLRHPALIREFPGRTQWIIIRIFSREQGLILRPSSAAPPGSTAPPAVLQTLIDAGLRWAMRQDGSGTQRFLRETLGHSAMHPNALHTVCVAHSEREAAAQVAMNVADIAPGTRASAREFNLDFLSTGWEAFDLVLDRAVYFRKLFQELLTQIQSGESRQEADRLQGYDFSESGQMIWSYD
jgi:putative molybdopterin biosynthesis protein